MQWNARIVQNLGAFVHEFCVYAPLRGLALLVCNEKAYSLPGVDPAL